MDKIFEILGSQPAVSIICTTIVLLALIYILRNQIVAYVKKKYDLYTENQVLQYMRIALQEYEENKRSDCETILIERKEKKK